MPAPPRDLPGDPRPLRSPLWLGFFTRILRRLVRRSFHAVRVVDRPAHDDPWAGRPLVIYSNHPSWWDGAVFPVLVTQAFPHRACYAPIDAAALSRYGFMRRLGFFGLERGTYQGASTFMRVGMALLTQPDTLLCITPQGHFEDVRRRPVRMLPGLAGLIARVPGVVVLPLALEYTFWDERAPEALARFGAALDFTESERRSTELVERRLQQALTLAQDQLADDAQSRDATRFETLIDGRAGVGGVYDGWRRLRAWIAGQPFDPSHGQERTR